MRYPKILTAAAAALALSAGSAAAATVHPAAPSASFGQYGTPIVLSNEGIEGAGQVSVDQADNRLYVNGNSPGTIHGFSIPNAATHTPLGAPFPLSVTGGFTSIAADDLAGRIYHLRRVTGGNPALSGFSSSGTALGSPFPVGGFGEPCGVALDGAGNIWVSEYPSVITELTAGGVPTGTKINVAGTGKSPITVCRMAFDRSDGDLYIISPNEQSTQEIGTLYRYSAASGYTVSNLIATAVRGVAVDSQTHRVYAVTGGGARAYAPNGAVKEEFATQNLGFGTIQGIAIDEASKAAYITLGNQVAVFNASVVPDVTTEGHSNVTSNSATVSGHVDPVGGGNVTNCYVEYGATTLYGSQTSCSPSTSFSGPEDVSAGLTGLASGQPYHYRFVAVNANGTSRGEDSTVIPAAAPSIESFSAAHVTKDSADLQAHINPNNADTKYRFEYGTTAAYGSTAPIPDEDIGSGQEAVAVSAHISGLVGSTYHFRVVAHSNEGTTTSEDQTFAFFPPSCPNRTVRQQTGGDYLPDCRAYEIVSPEDAGGVLLKPLGPAPSPIFATDPTRLAFIGEDGAITGTEPTNVGPDLYLATRSSKGWHTTHPGNKGFETLGTCGAVANQALSLFMDFRTCGILAEGVHQPPNNIGYGWSIAGESLGKWPANADAIPNSAATEGTYRPSPDFSHVAFSSRNVAFTPNGLTTAPGSAYDYNTATKSTTLISRTGGGSPIDIQQEPGNASLEDFITFPGTSQRYRGTSYPENTIHPGVSDDGSHIVMLTHATSSPSSLTRIYMRVNDAVTYEVSDEKAVRYVGMTSDGSKVFFTSTYKLTGDDHDNSADLYMWSESTNSLTRLSTGEGPGVGDTNSCSASWTALCGVTVPETEYEAVDSPVSELSGDVYFYSPEVLTGELARPGEENLYVYRNGAVHYVMTGEVKRIQVTPNGEHMAFISESRVTAYDNKGFAEMYTFDPDTEKLRCVSCPGEGIEPTGEVEGSSVGLFIVADGRTFFYTPDALVAADTDGLHDVYEFVDGRQQLITTGTMALDEQVSPGGVKAPRRAGLIGATENGNDVYFGTFESLVPQDQNGQFLKIYDARVNGGFAVEPQLAPCEAADECHGPGSNPPSLPAISSGDDLGDTGNATPASAGNKHKAKHHKAKRHHRHKNKHVSRTGNRRRSQIANGVGR